MNKAFILLFFLVLSFYSSAQNANTKVEQEITAIMERQEDAWNQGDIEGFMQSYWKSDSLLFIGGGGPRYGWKETLDKYRASYPDKESMGKLTFELIRFELIDNQAAHISGRWQLERSSDTLQGYYSLLWKKLKGEWLIVYDHSSSSKK